MQVAQGIHRFDTGPFNWYLIVEDGRFTLVDAGFPGHYLTFLEGIQSLGLVLKDLEAIILTHAHADHTGFAERVRKETRVPVFVHREDAAMASRVLQLPWWGLLSNAWRPFTAGMLGRALVNGVFTFPSIEEVQTFEDGAILDVPGHPQVLHLPGHTAGECAFFLPQRNALITGDTLVTLNLFTGEQGKPQVPHRLLNRNDQLAHRSLTRLKELGNLTVLPGHGAPWKGPVEEAIAMAVAPPAPHTRSAR